MMRTPAELADAVDAALRAAGDAGTAGPVYPCGPAPANRGPAGHRVRELRRGARWTQQQLATRIGFSVGMVRRVEQGDIAPTPAFARAVGQVFGVRPRDVDPAAAPDVLPAPAQQHGDAVGLVLEVLAIVPGAVEQGRTWPCLTAWAVARARWLAR